MTTETGNAQSESADPSYGLARWLKDQPLFPELDTPKAVYGGPSAGQMNMGQPAAQAPIEAMSRFDDAAMDGGDGGGSGLGGAARWGATEEKFASPFSTTNYGRYGSTIGNVVGGPFGGMVGAGLGGYFDIDNLDTQQASLGFGSPLSSDQVLSGYLNKSTMGILGNSWEDGSITNLLDAVAQYEAQNQDLMNKLNQDQWSEDHGTSGWASGGGADYGPAGGWGDIGFGEHGTDSYGDGRGSDDDDEGSAQGGRGDADGGGWD